MRPASLRRRDSPTPAPLPVFLIVACFLVTGSGTPDGERLARSIAIAEEALAKGDLEVARRSIRSALERDAHSTRIWDLEARRAELAGERDERIYALHRQLTLRVAQHLDADETARLRARIVELDPTAATLFGLKAKYVDQLRPIAAKYEKTRWPHTAIEIHRKILALDADNAESLSAIERLSATPDPSLAADAKPVDLLDGISKQWIADHDARHADWDSRATLERENYTTVTDAGYEVMARASAAMEQMNAFYRVFFDYGAGRSRKQVPRVELRIFKNRAEYLEFGTGPPAGWSGGQYTGAAVETYVGETGFAGMTGILFHEAAHQFVRLATNSAGWLNEGLASYFEGCELLNNGTVRVNQPATHRLFPLAARMERGWMADPRDAPEKAPTLRIVIENDYTWGPAWYAPTWGVVYFLYNFQDLTDGHFVYRAAFREFIDRSGGLSGDTAIGVFERVVLAHPAKPTKGSRSFLNLPASIDGLDDIWKRWTIRLRDRASGKDDKKPRYLKWAQHAIERGDIEDAAEFFELGIAREPENVSLLLAFGEFLADERSNEDRAVHVIRKAARLSEHANDVESLRAAKRRLAKLDPEVEKLDRIYADLIAAATRLPEQYLDDELQLMAMEVAWRLGTEFEIQALFETYERALLAEGRSPALWRLAYNEEDLRGWAVAEDSVFAAVGDKVESEYGKYEGGNHGFRFLALDEITSGDFSLEAEIQVVRAQVAFAGLVFGQKSPLDFHAVILFPPSEKKNGFADLATFYDDGSHETWRHLPVSASDSTAEDTVGKWYRLRVDVVGQNVDMWINDVPVASQEFPSAEVVRGRFGLLTGVGRARYRNVRYLSRRPSDPSSALERRLREEGKAGQSANGSWIGLTPPFPTVSKWIQGDARTSWSEKRGSPQLLVLWSRGQNDVVEIDRWLMSLNDEFQSVGLEILCIADTGDGPRVAPYVADHPFPGTVGIDAEVKDGALGPTFKVFEVDRFFLPRLLLIDVDGRVVWEGDPGFSANRKWSGAASLMRGPLESLIERRGLAKLAKWRRDWTEDAKPALAGADFATAWPMIEAASAFDAEFTPEVAEALAVRRRVELAIDAFEQATDEIGAAGCEPALAVLVEWGSAMKREPKGGAKALKNANVKSWKRAIAFLKPTLRKIDDGKDATISDTALERMESLGGKFCADLHSALVAAKDDPEALREICLAAAGMPARWLAVHYFGWK